MRNNSDTIRNIVHGAGSLEGQQRFVTSGSLQGCTYFLNTVKLICVLITIKINKRLNIQMSYDVNNDIVTL
jgi:hypothetical protein